MSKSAFIGMRKGNANCLVALQRVQSLLLRRPEGAPTAEVFKNETSRTRSDPGLSFRLSRMVHRRFVQGDRIDRYGLFRESLSRMLETTPYIRVVAQCTTIAEALAAFSRMTPDLVLLDYDLGNEQGSTLLTELKKRQSDAKVLMVTAGMSQVAAVSALEAGALGIFLKHSSLEHLLSAIHRVANGETWIDPLALRTLVSSRQPAAKMQEGTRPLTARQKEVMRGILDGFTNKEIGMSLKMSESSIKAVIQELFQKAGVRTRSQLVRIVIEKHSSDWLKPDLDA